MVYHYKSESDELLNEIRPIITIRCIENIEIPRGDEALTHLPAELLVLHAQPLLLGVRPHDHRLQHPVVLHQPLLKVTFAHKLGAQVLNLIKINYS